MSVCAAANTSMNVSASVCMHINITNQTFIICEGVICSSVNNFEFFEHISSKKHCSPAFGGVAVVGPARWSGRGTDSSAGSGGSTVFASGSSATCTLLNFFKNVFQI